jgi:tRNA pseudouridine38-40 synthase
MVIGCFRGISDIKKRISGACSPMKRNFKLLLRYDGSCYHGWQVQQGVPTIQGVLEEAIERVIEKNARVHASGRTDAGVHALGQVVHFAAETAISPEALQTGLNRTLPHDIRVLSSQEVPLTFHSRYNALSKVYRYSILNSRIHGRYRARSVLVFSPKLDLDRMRRAAAYLVGKHDFSSFGVNPRRLVEKPTRTIERLDVNQHGHYVFIEVEADGFLYKMVRSIVGTLLRVGVGRVAPEVMPDILESQDRCRAGATAPPQALCLVEVKYSDSARSEVGSEVPLPLGEGIWQM